MIRWDRREDSGPAFKKPKVVKVDLLKLLKIIKRILKK